MVGRLGGLDGGLGWDWLSCLNKCAKKFPPFRPVSLGRNGDLTGAREDAAVPAELALEMLKKQYNIFNMKATATNAPRAQSILRRIAAKGKGWAFTPNDFADLGDPRAVGMALTRLVRDGRIRRLDRGLYDQPHPHPLLGQAGAGTDAIVGAIARKKNLRVLPSTAVAANQLGLTTQVPAKLVYHTDGAPSELRLGKLHIVFRRNSGRMLGLAGRASGLVAQALRDFGKGAVTDRHVRALRDRLSSDQKKQLLADIDRVPAWMRPHFNAIASAEPATA